MARRRFICQNCGHAVFVDQGSPLRHVQLCRDCLEKARTEHHKSGSADPWSHNRATAIASGIERRLYDLALARYDAAVGYYASWAIWDAHRPENDLHLLKPDPLLLPALLKRLRNDVVMVGLNPSARIPIPLRNFHGGWGGSGKLRDAFRDGTPGEPYQGAYMTDFVTTRAEPKSEVLMSTLTPLEERENARRFIAELDDLGSEQPTILTFGDDAHGLVIKHVLKNRRGAVIPLPHYGAWKWNRRKDYRDELWRLLPSMNQGAELLPIGGRPAPPPHAVLPG
jgi:hypothetical protein